MKIALFTPQLAPELAHHLLRDAGHDVRFISAVTKADIATELGRDVPGALLINHRGAGAAHARVLEIGAAVRAQWPNITIAYGGEYPRLHWEDILREAPQIDIILRSECETAAADLIAALAARRPLVRVPGLAFRWAGEPFATAPCPGQRNREWFRHVRNRPLTGRPAASRSDHP